MDKIIELLIEYDWWDYVKNWLTISEKIKFEDYVSLTYYKDMTYEIISKEYRFIEWLVENDKIDFKKLYDDVSDYCEDLVPYPAYDCLLMLLAISEQPLKDLLSYLK